MTAILTSPRRALALLIAGSLALSGGALILAINSEDAVGSLFASVVTLPALAVLIGWALLAWLARRVAIGGVPEEPLGAFGLVWGGFRVSLLFAVVPVLCGWLVALALGHDLQFALLRASVLLVVFTALTGIMGGAIFNSSLAVGRWFGRTKAGAE